MHLEMDLAPLALPSQVCSNNSADSIDTEVTIQEEMKTKDLTVKQGKPQAYVG